MYVLYAEDNDEIAELVCSIFSVSYRSSGVKPIRVSDGTSAFHEFRLKEKIPKGREYSAIITDYDMPLMNGGELATLVREEYGSSVPIILHTSHDAINHIQKLDIDMLIPKSQVFDLVKCTLKILSTMESRNVIKEGTGRP